MQLRQQPATEVSETARTVGESFIHASIGVWSLSRAGLLFYRLFRSCPLKFLHLLRFEDFVSSKRMSPLSVMVLNSGSLRHPEVLNSHGLCGKKVTYDWLWVLNRREYLVFAAKGLTVESRHLAQKLDINRRLELRRILQGDGQQNTTLRYSPADDTRGMWIKDTPERRVVDEDESHSTSCA